MQEFFDRAAVWLTSVEFYVQLGAIAGALTVALTIALLIKNRLAGLTPGDGQGVRSLWRTTVFRSKNLILPVAAVVALAAAAEVSRIAVEQNWLVTVVQAIALVVLAFGVISGFVKSSLIGRLLAWVGVPLLTLHVFGWLDDVTAYLDGVAIQMGNIRLSVLAIGRTLFFGVILFWLGRVSSATGKRMIRSQPTLDAGAREIMAKLFEIALFFVIFVLLLQVMGINLTALAVFGGALGVGLGFGLQEIAANFVSGLIILLDRSITLHDYIELEDGRTGTVRELNLRSATLETYDGKDIVVPNQVFMTTTFTNWTHNNQKQRYSLNFSVAYKTDIPAMIDIVREVVASHPKVLSGDGVPVAERPDAEIAAFGDSGIDILVEFWMEGIDDGENRVGADLLLMIWTALKEHGIEIPFPQREVKLLNPEPSSQPAAT